MNFSFWSKRDVNQYHCHLYENIPFDKSTLWAKGDMILGNAKNGCRGAGICKISMEGRLKNNPCGGTIIPIYLARVNPFCLQLVIDKKRISFEQRKLHFLGDSINLSKPLQLSMDLSAKLGFQKPLVILPRRYALYQQKGFFHHFLDCQNEGLKVV